MNTAVESLTVSLEDRSYEIWVGRGILQKANELIFKAIPDLSHAFCVMDSSVALTHGNSFVGNLRTGNIRVDVVHVPSGESSKSVHELSRIWHETLDVKTDRSSVVFAIGGGVVGDLAGFAAASYARGLRLIQIPTTLLSQVDSSVGGKTGINLPRAKNMIGAFWQPSLVLIDTLTLNTLPEREYLSGMAEVVKYGIIMDPAFFCWVEDHVDAILERDEHALSYAIQHSCSLKADVITQDERETTGLRAILNFGHTFGHAIEAGTAYGAFLHGEAVATGMVLAAQLAVRLQRIPIELANRLIHLLNRLKLIRPTTELGSGHMWELMMSDKKVEHGSLSFVLPTRLGHVERVSNVPKEMVVDLLRDHGFF